MLCYREETRTIELQFAGRGNRALTPQEIVHISLQYLPVYNLEKLSRFASKLKIFRIDDAAKKHLLARISALSAHLQKGNSDISSVTFHNWLEALTKFNLTMNLNDPTYICCKNGVVTCHTFSGDEFDKETASLSVVQILRLMDRFIPISNLDQLKTMYMAAANLYKKILCEMSRSHTSKKMVITALEKRLSAIKEKITSFQKDENHRSLFEALDKELEVFKHTVYQDFGKFFNEMTDRIVDTFADSLKPSEADLRAQQQLQKDQDEARLSKIEQFRFHIERCKTRLANLKKELAKFNDLKQSIMLKECFRMQDFSDSISLKVTILEAKLAQYHSEDVEGLSHFFKGLEDEINDLTTKLLKVTSYLQDALAFLAKFCITKQQDNETISQVVHYIDDVFDLPTFFQIKMIIGLEREIFEQIKTKRATTLKHSLKEMERSCQRLKGKLEKLFPSLDFDNNCEILLLATRLEDQCSEIRKSDDLEKYRVQLHEIPIVLEDAYRRANEASAFLKRAYRYTPETREKHIHMFNDLLNYQLDLSVFFEIQRLIVRE